MPDHPRVAVSFDGIRIPDGSTPPACYRCGQPTAGKHRDACTLCIVELYAERAGQWFLVVVPNTEPRRLKDNVYATEAEALSARTVLAGLLGTAVSMIYAAPNAMALGAATVGLFYNVRSVAQNEPSSASRMMVIAR